MATTTAIVLNGQVGLLSTRQMLAASGKYWTVTNPTPGTAIAHALVTGFSATANGLILVQNKNPSGGANIQLDRLKLIQTATAPTGTLVMRFEAFAETGLVNFSGAFAARTPVNANPGFVGPATGALVQSFAAGAATVPAAVGTRSLVSIGSIQTGVAVAQDEYCVEFGSDGAEPGTAGLTAARATDPARKTSRMNPVTIAPQSTAWINMWWLTAAANTPSFEFELGYIET